ncbi:FG-GAP-like repeat-containing protein [Streptomyces sp. NBC_00841]|uniref:FG-GAP-like repeat-containing protein n=2 Tax=unclassified Streptomyces TaxID=2593676 RepID=UPI0022598DD9|nr:MULTISPECIES: FG-GAP-like repeat-containing protein [unclassified Streptomyces]MCX4531580.1 FG-GAP-like repeat-containing protein [Streptomyces sp. NBC_01669]WSA02850.1 FG-GAP-like repeat-containing protein [Streptomyces sp. NBC_00841]
MALVPARLRSRIAIAVAAAAGAALLAVPQAAYAVVAPVTADFNKDGKADLAVGIPQAADTTITGAGAVSIAPGSATGSNGATKITLTQNSLAGGIDLPGSSETDDQFGATTAWGDINGDGYADLAVAAPGEDDTSGHTDAGGITLLYGSATGLTADTTMYFAPASARVGGDRCGEAMTIGDFNADGKADVLAFCPGSYAMWVIDGATRTVKDTAPQQVTEGASALSLTSAADADAASGDIDKDGYPDAVVTFTQWDGTSPLYILPGSATGLHTDTATSLEGAGGADVAVGDLNKDTFPDVVVGQPAAVTGGRVTAYYGSATGLSDTSKTTLDQDSSGVPGASESGDDMGASVAVGDVNKDGYADVLTGAPGEDLTFNAANQADAGTTLLLKGSATGLTGTGSVSLNSGTIDATGDMAGAPEPGDRLGTAVALLDATNDGYADMAAGASGENSGDGMVLMANSSATGILASSSAGPGIGTFNVPAGAHIGDVLAP